MTEMWERYGFYVVQTLLALYLVMYHNWDDVDIYPIIGAFTALTYLSPVIGGWIADHLLGQKRRAFVFLSLSIPAATRRLCPLRETAADRPQPHAS